MSQAGVEIDWEALAVAVENQLPSAHSFLDRDSGRVITLRAPADAPPPAEPGDWLAVPQRPSREGYQTMQRFVEQVEDEALRERLAGALVGRGAFRRFKDQLLDAPEVRQQWFAFKDAEVYAFVADWLAQQGIEPANAPPDNPSRSRFSAAVRRTGLQRPPLGEPRAAGLEPDAAEPDWQAAIAPFDRPDRTFQPERCALLVIDAQRIFLDPDSRAFLPLSVAAARRLGRLVEVWRQAALPLVFTRHVHRNPAEDGGAMARWWRSLIMDGSAESELVEALAPRDGERVIKKSRYSAFANTELEMVLRSLGIRDVLIGGVMTNLCCETTAREAFVRDFNVFLLGDGTAAADPELHLGSLRNIAYGFGRVLGVAEALRAVAAD